MDKSSIPIGIYYNTICILIDRPSQRKFNYSTWDLNTGPLHNIYKDILRGVYVVIFYAVELVRHAGVTIDPFLGAVLLGVFQLICNLGASYALNRCGRRPMSLISGTFMTFCMVGLGLYLQLAEDTDLSWVPLVLIMVFIGATAVGFNTIPWAMLGELFPASVKGPSGGITTCLSYSWSFAATKLHPGGYAEVFYFYGCASAVATVYLLLFLPETFGKTLHQIGEDFKKPGTGLNCCQRKKEISLVT